MEHTVYAVVRAKKSANRMLCGRTKVGLEWRAQCEYYVCIVR